MNTNNNKNKIFLIILLIVFGLSVLPVLADSTRPAVGDNFCGEPSVLKIFRIAGYLLIIVKILIPLIIIIMGTLDLYKAVIGKDEKELPKQAKILLLRIAVGIFIFFIPNLTNWFLDLMFVETNSVNTTKCVDCLLSPTSKCDIP